MAPVAKIEFAFAAPVTVKNLEDSSGYTGIKIKKLGKLENFFINLYRFSVL